jgi:rare lipoprotein A
MSAVRTVMLLGALALALLLAGCNTARMVQAAGQSAGTGEAIPQTRYIVGVPYRINGVWYYPEENFSYDRTGIASFYGGERSGVDFHGRLTANGEVYDMNGLTAAHNTLPLPTLVRVTHLENGRSIIVRVNDRGPFVNNRIIDLSRRGAQLLGYERSGTATVRVQVLGEESRRLRDALLAGQPPPADLMAQLQGGTSQPAPAQAVAQAPTQVPASPTPVVIPAAMTGPGPDPGAPSREVPIETAALPEIDAPPPPVRPVSHANIYIQAGAFQSHENADHLGARLRAYGRPQISAVRQGGGQMYRVRLGPYQQAAEANRVLRQVIGVAPTARVVIE